jgi:peptide/nickel transport system substrate-binding protein
VKYTLDRTITLGGNPGAILNGNRGIGNLVAGVDAPNATTVVIRLKQPFPNYAEIMTYAYFGIVEPSLVEANGGIVPRTPNQWMASHSAGGGPYILESYDPNTRAVLVANPRYFGKKPYEKRVIVNFVPSDPTSLFQASAGKADVTVGLTLQAAASLRGNACCKIVATDYPTFIFVSLPNKRAPFDNLKFRQALAYVTPTQAIAKTVAFGYASTFYGPYPEVEGHFNKKLAGKPHPFSVAKAKELVQQSGATLPVNLDLIIREGDNDHAKLAAIIQAQWKQVGVNITIKTLAASAYIAARSAHPKDFSMIVAWSGGFNNPYWTMNFDLRCNHVNNTSEYCNPALDKAMDDAFLAPPAKQQALWDQFTKLWIADAPRVPLYSPKTVVVLQKNVKRYYAGGVGLHLWEWGR